MGCAIQSRTFRLGTAGDQLASVTTVGPDAELLAVCARLRELQAEWQRLWDATPDSGRRTRADRALDAYMLDVWPGMRLGNPARRRPGQADPVGRLLELRATTPEGIAAKAAAVLAIEKAGDFWGGDPDPFLLGTPGGTVDLRTGTMRSARPSDHITKLAAVAPSRAVPPDLWLRFLDDATGRDEVLIRFLQQWCGYCLTGDTREHALLFGYGPGGNGKSVFLNTVAGIMGDYATVAAMDTFTASHGDRHPTDLAGLRGARLVTGTETEEGRAWAESRLKQMTGSDPISARFMRQDFFTFRPAFKLVIVGNHKPVLKNVDDAARRRFNIVPFTRRPVNPDRELEAKLRAEWPGILAWMLDGCLDWQQHGLQRPAVVTEATAEYFEVQDHFGRWLAECCTLLPTMSTKPSHLLHSFQKWCAENGEPEADNRRLRGLIERTHGLRYATNKGVHWVRGIGLRPPARGEGVMGGEGSWG